MDERRAEEESRRKIEEDRRDDALEDASQQLTVEAEFIEASELVDILENLKLLNDRLSAAASPQGNVVILRGSKNAVDEARQLISSLDTEPEQSADSNARLEDFRIRTLFPLMQEESLLKDQLGDGHPKLMAIRKRIETAEQQLDELFGTSNEASLDLDILEFEVSEPVDVEDAQRKYAAI